MNQDGTFSCTILSVGSATIGGLAMTAGAQRLVYTTGATLAGIQLVATGGSWYLDNRSDNTFQMSRGGSALLTVSTSGDLTMPATICAGTYTVGTLPTASSNAYKFANVSDSSVTSFGSTVAGGGSSKVMVFSNGTNWTVCAA